MPLRLACQSLLFLYRHVDAILYLEGVTFVTGEILHVDGGQSAGH